jgi:hypothetical protein
LQKFRLYEEAHLKQMKEFVDKYASTWRNQHAVLGQVLLTCLPDQKKHKTLFFDINSHAEQFLYRLLAFWHGALSNAGTYLPLPKQRMADG